MFVPAVEQATGPSPDKFRHVAPWELPGGKIYPAKRLKNVCAASCSKNSQWRRG